MIGDLFKTILSGDTTDNTTAAALAAAFPLLIPSEANCPLHLYQCLKTLILSGMPDPPSQDVADYVSEVYGDSDVPVEGGIYFYEVAYESIGDTPGERGAHLDTPGAEYSMLTTFVRMPPPLEDSYEAVLFTKHLIDQIDRRIRWLINFTTRIGRIENNPTATYNTGLSPYLDASLDPNLNNQYTLSCYYLKSKQRHALEMTSFYEVQYVSLIL